MPEYRSKYVASLDIVVVCDLPNAVFNTISNAARLKYLPNVRYPIGENKREPGESDMVYHNRGVVVLSVSVA